MSAVLGMRMRVHGDVLLVERRDELLAEPGEKKSATPKNSDGARRSPERAIAQRARAAPARTAASRPGQLRSRFLALGPLTAIAIMRRDEGQRKNESSGERDDHGQRHRLEHLAFDAA